MTQPAGLDLSHAMAFELDELFFKERLTRWINLIVLNQASRCRGWNLFEAVVTCPYWTLIIT
jgi:hypothetical protein